MILQSSFLFSLTPVGCHNLLNQINLNRYCSAYEGDGKTTAKVINKNDSPMILVKAVNSHGFVLANGMELVGSAVFFPHSVFCWNVRNVSEINEEAMTLFKILDPKLDILVLGFGAVRDYTPEAKQMFTKICKQLGIKFEALPTEQAVGLYNFLAYEMRFVAAALIPPSIMNPLKLDKRKSLSLSKNLYEDIDDDDKIEDIKKIGSSSNVKRIK